MSPILAAALLCLAFSPSILTAAETNLSKLSTLAQQYERQGKYDEAAQIYRHILSIDPTQKQLLTAIERLNTKIDQNMVQKSSEPIKPTIVKAPKSTPTSTKRSSTKKRPNPSLSNEQKLKDDQIIARGFEALEHEQLDDAMGYFNQILKRRSKNTLSLYGKAQIHAKRNEWEMVEKTLHREARINKAPGIQTLYKQALTQTRSINQSTAQIPVKSTTSSQSKRLSEAENYLSRNQLREAESLLSELYISNPSNIDIQLRLAETYSKMGQFTKAKEYYQTVLAFSPKNIYAQEGLANSYYALNEYKQALLAFEKIDKSRWNKELDYNYKMTKIAYYIENKEYTKGQTVAEELYKKYPNRTDTIRQLANLSSALSPDEAIRYRTLAYQQTQENGDLIALIYALIDAERFTQAETYFNALRGKEFSNQESEEFKKLYLVYYRKLSSTQLSQKQYEQSERTARSGLLLSPNDPDLHESYGWSLLNQNKPSDALKVFESLLAEHPSDKIYYAAALSAHSGKQNKKSYGYLFKASKTKDIALLQKIAELYNDMGYREESLDTIRLIEDTKLLEHPSSIIPKPISPSTTPKSSSPLENKDLNGVYNPFLGSNKVLNTPKTPYLARNESVYSMQKSDVSSTWTLPLESAPIELNSPSQRLKKEILSEKQSSLSGSFFFENRSGTSGIDRLSKVVLPLQVTLNPSFKHTIKVGVNSMILSTGDLSKQDRSQLGYGRSFGGNYNIEHLSAAELFASYRYKNNTSEFEAMIGTTPINDPIGNSTFTGYLQATTHADPLHLTLRAIREPVSETLLSYVGQRDPDNADGWGRVVRNGFEASIDYSKEWITSFGLGYYPSIKGFNTIDNSESKATLFIGKNLIASKEETLLLGPLLVFDQYERSTNHFTYGHGGYFSPTSYSLFGVYGDYTNILDQESYFRVKGNIGYSMFEESEEPYLPLNPDNRTYAANSDSGFTMTLKGYGGIKLTPQWHLLGSIGFSVAPQYNDMMGGGSLIYYFDPYALSKPDELERVSYIWDKIK